MKTACSFAFLVAVGGAAIVLGQDRRPETIYSYRNPKPLPALSGPVVKVSTVSQFVKAINDLTSNKTIVIAAGTYDLTKSGTDGLYLPRAGLTKVSIRGATGKADDVVITGNNMSATGSMRFGFWLQNVSTWTIADLTLRNARSTGIFLSGNNNNGGLIHNVRMIDMGDQFVKVGPSKGYGTGTDKVTVEYCIFRYSDPVLGENKDGGGENKNYTNGVDVHGGSGWNVQYNLFENFFHPSGLAGPAVLFWNGSGLRGGNTVNGNTFINNARAISMGLVQQASGRDNTGGIVSNNVVYSSSSIASDVAIGVMDSPNTQVFNNTIMTSGYPNCVEYRFAATKGVIVRNNLSNVAIAARDGASGTVSNNVTDATNSLFVNATAGDLHLLSTASVAIGKGVPLTGFTTDIDGQTRGGAWDLGADQFVKAAGK